MLRWIRSTSQKYGHRIAGVLSIGAALILLTGSVLSPVGAEQTQSCPPQAGTARSEAVSPVSQMVPTTEPSTIYGKPQPVRVYLPPCYAPDNPIRYPVIYLLHGASADETQWPDLNVQSAADKLFGLGVPPFVVVMPGAPYGDAVDYSAYVLKELLPGIESRYRVQTVRAGRAIGGLSLGGYWAMKIAFSHPDLFAVVGGYSPVVSLGMIGDPLPLARQATVKSLQGLQIALDVGNVDSLSYDTNQLAKVLRGRGIPVTLTVGLGGHERLYWRTRTYDYLLFLMNSIGPIYYQNTPEPDGTIF